MGVKPCTHVWLVGERKKPKRKLKNLESNDSENMGYQHLWDVAKAALRGKFIAVNAYIKKN